MRKKITTKIKNTNQKAYTSNSNVNCAEWQNESERFASCLESVEPIDVKHGDGTHTQQMCDSHSLAMLIEVQKYKIVIKLIND